MYAKLLIVLSVIAVSLARTYPPGVSAAVCPDYPYCDPNMLARFTLDGHPVPEWVYNPYVLPGGPLNPAYAETVPQYVRPILYAPAVPFE